MDTIINRCKEFIEKNHLLKPKEKVILAVSGGPDSIFLFHLFCFLRKEKGIEFAVAHLNHCLREEADEEEAFVEELCRGHNLRFISQRKDLTKFSKGDSLEQRARNLRYDFFLATARRLKRKKVVLAHHKDDLVETVLLRLVRGTGLLGLRGMRPLSKYKKVFLVRPLLFLEKEEILTYLKSRKLSYMIDKSNFEDVFLRNKIRHNLMPSLEKIAASYKDTLYFLSRSISWDYDFIYAKSQAALEKAMLREKEGRIEIKISRLKDLHMALVYNLIRLCIERSKGNLRRMESKHIELIVELLFRMPKGSVVDTPGLKVQKGEDCLIFQRIPDR